MIYFAALSISIGFGLAIAAFGSAIGIGKSVQAALEGTARQPEAANSLQVTMIIGAALLEALTIYVLVAAILLLSKLPEAESVIAALGGGH